jgi:CheY-like chemotaxis protein
VEDRTASFLIVDDEPDMCWALGHLLEKNGFCATIARSGKDALQLMQENCFPLAFLDAKLPDIDGLELAQQIRGIDPAIRIVMVSGYYYGDDLAIQQALSEGSIRGFISKPYLHEEIIRTLKNVFSC